ncbi:MAG: VCBS repeat-containing protein, partial [Bacteroidota bacterium]
PDIYVANDFIKPDLLYINQGDGTFKDEIQAHFRHISFYSMGTDYADISNDGKNDLYVADMAMNGHVRSKRNMGSMSTENFQTIIRRGYHYPYSSNTLQLNVGQNNFADIAQAVGVAKTDWSWSPLLMDYDNDGYKDIFVTNGIYRDIVDNDFLAKKASYDEQEERNYFDDLLSDIPQTKVNNFLFQNQGDLTFKDRSGQWGIHSESNSNGAAYADLDLDGDLDLIVNNLNAASFIYENLCAQKTNNNYLNIKLIGSNKNKSAIGAKVTIFYGEEMQSMDMQPARGYLSTVDYKLHFGLGNTQNIDKIEVLWPDGKTTTVIASKVNTTLHLDYKKASNKSSKSIKNNSIFEDQTALFQLQHIHSEKDYDDFSKELLLPHKQSENGPFLSVADVNADGLDDFYIGGSAGFAGTLYLQNTKQGFTKSSQSVFAQDRKYEDQKSLFFDADQDGDLDLYVVSGSNEFEEAKMYQDRLYLNDGKGNFSKTSDALPKITASGSTIVANDLDRDGDLDVVVGGRVVASKYPTSPRSYVLENQEGKFIDVTKKIAPDFTNIGMISDLLFSDYDQDGDEDLIVVGEWMPIKIFDNENGQFKDSSNQQFDKSNGWWQSITAADVDADGDVDYVLGNIGKNNKYQPTADKSLHIYYHDFDDNGTGDIVLSKKDQGALVPVRGRECSSQQMPFIEDKFENFNSFATASLSEIYDAEKLENALHYEAHEFASLLLENKGGGEFEQHYLPTEAQFSPLMRALISDINQDGYLDIIGAGNFFATETETIRYDAGSGFVLLGDGKHNFKALAYEQSGLMLKDDVRDMQWIQLSGGRKGLLVASNRGKLKLLVVNAESLRPLN